MKSIQFFFELASPYSYIASLQIESIAAKGERSVDWRPIEIEAVWSAQGVLEAYAAVRRVKRNYIAIDSRRCAATHGIALAKPVTSARATSLAKLAFWVSAPPIPSWASASFRLFGIATSPKASQLRPRKILLPLQQACHWIPQLLKQPRSYRKHAPLKIKATLMR